MSEKVLLNHRSGLIQGLNSPDRRVVEAILVKKNAKTAWYRLPNGDLVQRRLRRDVEGVV